jgi:hypothetical protein
VQYDSKPNQFRTFQTSLYKTKKILAIKIDLRDNSVKGLLIDNHIDAVKAILDFHNYKELNARQLVGILPDKQLFDGYDHFIVANDVKEIDPNKYFKLHGVEQKFMGNAMLVGIFGHGDLGKLKSTKCLPSELGKLVVFS